MRTGQLLIAAIAALSFGGVRADVIQFYTLNDSTLGVGYFDYERTYFSSGSSDVVDVANYCAPEGQFECILAPTNFLVFAAPRGAREAGDTWFFAGYNFLVVEIEVVDGDRLTLISSTPTEVKMGPAGISKSPASLFLVSEKFGLVQFTSTFLNEDNEPAAEVRYDFLGGGLDLRKLERIGYPDARLGQDQIQGLASP